MKYYTLPQHTILYVVFIFHAEGKPCGLESWIDIQLTDHSSGGHINLKRLYYNAHIFVCVCYLVDNLCNSHLTFQGPSISYGRLILFVTLVPLSGFISRNLCNVVVC